ncbi:hypothetical protein P7L75_27545 [Tistrella mobilis]
MMRCKSVDPQIRIRRRHVQETTRPPCSEKAPRSRSFGSGGRDQGIEEGCPIPVGQSEGLMFGDRSAGGLDEGGDAEITHLAPRPMGGTLDQFLGLFVQPEAETFDPAWHLPLGAGLLVRHGDAPAKVVAGRLYV